jgi:hypothetical protein
MALNQREATFQAITTVLSNSGVNFTSGEDVKSVLTSEHKKKVREILVSGLKDGSITSTPEFMSKMSTDTDLSKYTSGLISNWIKKDPRLNGNKKHQSSGGNSSSNRVGNSDSQVKELKKLLKATVGTDSEQEVAEALNARINELKVNKTSRAKSSISVESIPENLQHLVK